MTQAPEGVSMTIPDEIANGFAECFDSYAAYDLGTRLACEEADAMAALLAVFNRPDLAAAWLDAHAQGDDSGDKHFRQPA